jgi:exosortase
LTTEPESNAPLTQSHADRVVSPLASRLRIGLFLVLVGWAFGSALGLSFEGGLPGRHELGAFFFASSRLPPGLVLAVAGWLAWRRLPGFQSVVRGDQARSSGAQAVALLLFALCVFASGWARLTGAADLLLPAFALFLLALASSWAGWAGMRSMALPALLILFGLPIPSPLDNEILWQLQLWSARGAELLLTLFGVAVERVGIHLVSEDTRFLVVESCSGQRAILTLTLVALILRELFEGRGRRQWLLVVIAPPIAYLVNVARIAIIIAGQAGEEVVVADDHIGQGLATLAAGSIALFVIGHFLAGRPSERPPREPIRWETFPGRSGALCLVLLVMASSLLPPWTRPQSIVPDVRAFPGSRGGWQSEVEVVDQSTSCPRRGSCRSLTRSLSISWWRRRRRRAGVPGPPSSSFQVATGS